MAGGVRIDRAKAAAAVHAMSQQAVMRGASNFREKVRQEILTSGRVDTGQMHNDIEVAPLPPTPGKARARVTPRAPHFIFQDQGTRGSVARPGGVLRFLAKGSGVVVFTRRTRGVTAGEFLKKARLKMTIRDFV